MLLFKCGYSSKDVDLYTKTVGRLGSRQVLIERLVVEMLYIISQLKVKYTIVCIIRRDDEETRKD